FASWCFACREEHSILMSDGKQLGVKLVGFNYKDAPADAKRWLAQFGNPYDLIIADVPGDVAIDFGVTGAPESFLVDAQGIVRYKYISPITPEVIATQLLPRIAAMKKEAK
ncbi:MAG TPA: redoxin family protein, partial [Dokdonella sp.]